MRLKPGEYDIPIGYIVKVLPGARSIVVKPRSIRGIPKDEHRCRDCKHQVPGYCTQAGAATKVCELRPKSVQWQSVYTRQVFYRASDFGYPCERFELKTNKK